MPQPFACDDESVVFGRERRADGWPEPRLAAGGEPRVEFLDGGARVGHGLCVALRVKQVRAQIVTPMIDPRLRLCAALASGRRWSAAR